MKTNMALLGYLWKRMSPDIILLMLYQLSAQTIGLIANVWLLAFVIHQMETKSAMGTTALVILLFASYSILINLFWSYFHEVRERRLREKLRSTILTEVYDKLRDMTLEIYDDPAFHERFLIATDKTEDQIWLLLDTIAATTGLLISILCTGVSFLLLDPVSLLLVILSVVMTLFLQRPINRIKEELIKKERLRQGIRSYHSQCFYLKDSLRKLRLSGIAPALKADDIDSARHFLDTTKKSRGILSVLSFLRAFLPGHVMLQFILCAWLIYCILIRKSLSLAGFIAIYKGADVMVSGLTSLFGTYSEKLKECAIFSEAFLSFRRDPLTGQASSVSHFPGARDYVPTAAIAMRDICFSYPGGAPVIHHVELTIQRGEKIAIVGANGSGKTTLALLLLRLYKSSSGELYLDGHSDRELSLPAWRDRFAVLLQDFRLYELSISENITMGEECDDERVKKALLAASVPFLISDTDRHIGKEFCSNGLELSGGQKLRTAIARTLYRDRELMILDEPGCSGGKEGQRSDPLHIRGQNGYLHLSSPDHHHLRRPDLLHGPRTYCGDRVTCGAA